MIGNDVVDLRLSASESNWKRRGFLQKVFTASEHEQILSAANQEIMVWLLWSMKEAAYKAHQRQFNLPRKLNWQAQKCLVSDFDDQKASGVIEVGAESYYSFSRISSEAIFTSVVNDLKIPVEDKFIEQPSEVMKKEFFMTYSTHYNLLPEELLLHKNKNGIPILTSRKQRNSPSFSFTSHGRFSAFSLELTNC